MQETVDLLRLQDVQLTPALERDEGNFGESIASLLRSDLIRSVRDPRGEILFFEESRRRVLDLYRNAIVHFLAAPSFLARQLLSGASLEELRRELASWLDMFYYEYFTPRGEVLAAHLGAFIDHFESFGLIERDDGRLRATEKGIPYFQFLAEQTRGVVEVYYATFAAVLAAEGEFTARELRKAASEQFERSGLLGEVDHQEAANPVAFANAVEYLVRRRVLAPSASQKEGERPRDAVYARGESFEDLAAAHERLATTLAAR
jgi:glycerol-3-phosphate O-acyltransferase